MEDGQSIDQDHGKRTRGRKRKSSRAKSGFEQDVSLFVPHTPKGELAKRIRKMEAENHQGRSIRFKIIEKSGIT